MSCPLEGVIHLSWPSRSRTRAVTGQAVLTRAATLHRDGTDAEEGASGASKGITPSTGTTAQAFACFVVVMIHIGLFWLLALKPRYETTTPADHSRLRLIFLPRPPPPAPASPPPATALPMRPGSARLPSPASSPPTSSPTPAPATETASAPAVDFASQAAAWAAQSADSDFGADPLRSRRAQLPGGEQPGRFAMRPPPSPQRTLRKIGQLLGGPNYTTDPCPEIREKLAGLMTDTSEAGRRALDHEQDLNRRWCRP